MKKRWIVVCLIMSLLLAGCGKVTEAEEAIAAIGTVRQSSEPAIQAAETLVAALSERQQGQVENIQALLAAREVYDALIAAEASIEAIGRVSPSSQALIEAAEKAYAALPEEQKAMVGDYDTLVEAREDYDKLVSLISRVEDAVAAIGEVTLGSEEAIEAAVKAVEAAEDAGLTGYFEPAKKQLQEAQVKLLQIQADELVRQVHEQMEQKNYEAVLTYIVRCQAEYGPYTDPEELIPILEQIQKDLEKNRPRNGKFFNKRINGGENKLVVTAGNMDALVKVVSVDNPEQFVLYYVRAGESFTFNIASGEYYFRYVTGPYWFGDEEMFGTEFATYTEADEPIKLETEVSGWTIYYTQLEIKLDSAFSFTGSHIDSSEIDADEF